MMTYTPEAWVPVLIESEKFGKVYKVFAGWYGGYLGSDSWKLSSGIESIQISEDGSVLTMPQSSGSTYIVGMRTDVTMLMGAVFEGFEKQAAENNFTIKMLTVEELLEVFSDQQKQAT